MGTSHKAEGTEPSRVNKFRKKKQNLSIGASTNPRKSVDKILISLIKKMTNKGSSFQEAKNSNTRGIHVDYYTEKKRPEEKKPPDPY